MLTKHNGYKINPILRTIATDQIDLIQSCDRGDGPVVRYYIDKIVADLNRIKKYTEEET